jgi:hypothetical protein
MSSAVEVAQATSEQNRARWGLWLRQIGAIFRLEIEKNFLSRRSILIYLIALLPLFPLALLALFTPPGNEWRDFNNTASSTRSFTTFDSAHAHLLRSAWIFMNLFRGELVDRSLHYYFLSAVRREVLVVGKYISGLVTSIILFTTTTVVAMLLLYFRTSTRRACVTSRRAVVCAASDLRGHHDAACVGYGAFFLVVGLFIRNPIIPALLLYGWEWLNFLLPPLLKKISVIHYLNSLVPVPISKVHSRSWPIRRPPISRFRACWWSRSSS